jgi:hypothetical protein
MAISNLSFDQGRDACNVGGLSFVIQNVSRVYDSNTDQSIFAADCPVFFAFLPLSETGANCIH